MRRPNHKILLSEKEYLKVATRAGRLKDPRLMSVYYNNVTLKFRTPSGTHEGVFWEQEVRIEDLLPHMHIFRTVEQVKTTRARSFSIRNTLKKTPLTTRDIDKTILESPIKAHCNCPAWLYWGYRYIGTRLNYSLYPIHKRPRIRNPRQQGYLCFKGGTPVLTEQGYRPIEDIKIGDKVFTHRGRLREVISLTRGHSEDFVKIRTGYSDWIESTPDHPFLSLKRTALSPTTYRQNPEEIKFNDASELTAEDYMVSPLIRLPEMLLKGQGAQSNFSGTFVTEFESLRVIPIKEHIQTRECLQPVYSFEVEEDGTYLVPGATSSNCKHLYRVLSDWPHISNVVTKKLIKEGIIAESYPDLEAAREDYRKRNRLRQL